MNLVSPDPGLDIMSDQKNGRAYVFFLRSYNDADNIAPLIDYLIAQKQEEVVVISTDPGWEHKSHPVVKFFEKEHDLSVVPLHALAGLPGRCPIPVAIQGGGPAIWEKLRSGVLSFVRRFTQNRWRRVVESLRALRPKVLIFDHVKPTSNFTAQLVAFGRLAKIPTLSLPHGLINRLESPSPSEQMLFDFDYVVAANEIQRMHLLDSKIPAERISTLGCMRYSQPWLERYWAKVETESLESGESNPEKPRLVFFVRIRHGVDADLVTETLKILKEHSHKFEVIIKPHTRLRSSEVIQKWASDAGLTVDWQTSTPVLLKWADIAVTYASSIVYEIYARDKTYVHLEYLMDFSSVFTEGDACWKIDTPVQLGEALGQGLKPRPYSQLSVTKLVSKAIYNQGTVRDVIQDHYAFLSGISDSVEV